MKPATLDEALAFARSESPETRAQRQHERDLELLDRMGQRRAAYRIEIARKLSNVGERFSERTLDSYACPPGDPYALSIAREILEADGTKGVWFSGGRGTGKTHLAAGIVNALTARGISAVFSNVVTLVDQLQASYDRGGNLRANHIDVIRWLAEVDVLVLDDIDKAEFTARMSQRIYALVNRRYENGGSQRRRPVIVTSNHEPAEVAVRWHRKGLDETIGATILDRFRELCGQFVSVEGESYRERLMEGIS